MLGGLLLLPATAMLGTFLLLPLLYLLAASVTRLVPGGNEVAGLTASHYAVLWDWYYLRLFLGTLRVGLVVTVLCAILSYPIAYVLARAGRRLAQAGMLLLALPLMTSAVIAAFGWLLLLGRRGMVNAALDWAGIGPLSLLNSELAVEIALVQLLIPYMVLPLLGSIETIPVTLEEVACNLGCGFWTMGRRVLLPLSVPGLLSGSVLVFGIAVSSLIVPAMLGGREGRMVGNDIFEHLLVSFDLPMAACLAAVLMSVTLGVVAGAAVLAGRLQRRWAT